MSAVAPSPASSPASLPASLSASSTGRAERAWAVLQGVPDPEVPALSVTELGIVREVNVPAAPGDPALEVVVTPTYSGCPATEVIAASIAQALEAAGLGPARITQRRAPAWTTDWITPAGREKLRAYGIAPPGACAAGAPVRVFTRVPCPRCGSTRTEQLSAFGSTACKALHRCLDCREPFEYFKPL